MILRQVPRTCACISGRLGTKLLLRIQVQGTETRKCDAPERCVALLTAAVNAEDVVETESRCCWHVSILILCQVPRTKTSINGRFGIKLLLRNQVQGTEIGQCDAPERCVALFTVAVNAEDVEETKSRC